MNSKDGAVLHMDAIDADTDQLLKTIDYTKHYPSTHCYEEWEDGNPIGMVDHYTAGDNHINPMKWFSNRFEESQASAHFVIATDGTTYSCIPLDKPAWHIGDRTLNKRFIGIEHCNIGSLVKRDGKYYWWRKNWSTEYTGEVVKASYRDYDYYAAFTKEQIVASIRLKRTIMAYKGYDFYKEGLIDHASLRSAKRDMGPAWPAVQIVNAVFADDMYETRIVQDCRTTSHDQPSKYYRSIL